MAKKLAIIGATGNVGREILRLIEVDAVAVDLVLAASADSAGELIPVGDTDFTVQKTDDLDFEKIDVAIFAVPTDVSTQYLPKAKGAGVKVVDLSTAFAADEAFSLDVNVESRCHVVPDTTAQLLASALSVIQEMAAPLRGDVTALYPASFSGRAAMDELFSQSASLIGGAGAEAVHGHAFSAQVGFNVIPQVGPFKGAHSSAELAVMTQTNRLIDSPVALTVSALTVPTFVGVSAAVTLTFNEVVEVDKIRDKLSQAAGITCIDNPEKQEYSTPFGTAETEGIYVSRLRSDFLSGQALQFWLTGDSLRLAAKQALAAALQ